MIDRQRLIQRQRYRHIQTYRQRRQTREMDSWTQNRRASYRHKVTGISIYRHLQADKQSHTLTHAHTHTHTHTHLHTHTHTYTHTQVEASVLICIASVCCLLVKLGSEKADKRPADVIVSGKLNLELDGGPPTETLLELTRLDQRSKDVRTNRHVTGQVTSLRVVRNDGDEPSKWTDE